MLGKDVKSPRLIMKFSPTQMNVVKEFFFFFTRKVDSKILLEVYVNM